MEIAQDVWMLETKKEECKAVSIQLDKLQKMLFPKIDTIVSLSEKYFLEISVTIVIEMTAGDGPELVLSKDNVAFLALINAEVGFGLYIE